MFLLGLPCWLIILTNERNWILAGLELTGGLSMILGILTSTNRTPPRWLEYLIFILIPLGLGYSIYDFGGITNLNQLLEILSSFGFLIGTYLLAKDNSIGYIMYLVMHLATSILLLRQNYFWLTVQQLLSLVFVFDAIAQRRKNKNE